MTAPSELALMSFEEACARVVGYLKEWVPLSFWSVSRVDGGAAGTPLRRATTPTEWRPGRPAAWSESFCRYMVAGLARRRSRPTPWRCRGTRRSAAELDIEIGAYAGVPIHNGDGSLFGTLCGIDPVVQDDDLLQQAPLLHLLATLLGQILACRAVARGGRRPRATRCRGPPSTTPLTGLPNRAMFLDLLAGVLEPTTPAGPMRRAAARRRRRRRGQRHVRTRGRATGLLHGDRRPVVRDVAAGGHGRADGRQRVRGAAHRRAGPIWSPRPRRWSSSALGPSRSQSTATTSRCPCAPGWHQVDGGCRARCGHRAGAGRHREAGHEGPAAPRRCTSQSMTLPGARDLQLHGPLRAGRRGPGR